MGKVEKTQWRIWLGDSEKYQNKIFVLNLKEENLTKLDLQRMHSEYNRMYFGGRLSMPEFYFIRSKRPYGRYMAGKNAKIGLSAFRKDWTEDFLKDVLIHEMIHQYVYERLCGSRYSLVQHGLQFHFVRWKLKRNYGLKISGGPIF